MYIEKQFGRLNDMQREAVFTTNGPLPVSYTHLTLPTIA